MKKFFEFIENELYIFYLCCLATKQEKERKKRGRN